MSGGLVDLVALKKDLVAAGLEIYSTRATELAIAERVRMHLMDAGVSVLVRDGLLVVRFVGRAQKSDDPDREEGDAFELVRARIGVLAAARRYGEANAQVISVSDPHESSRVLDTWYEIAFECECGSKDDCIAEVRWALSIERYVA